MGKAIKKQLRKQRIRQKKFKRKMQRVAKKRGISVKELRALWFNKNAYDRNGG